MSGVFAEIDADGDGHITLSELTNYLQKKGSSKSAEEISALFHEADKNGVSISSVDSIWF